MNFIDLQKNIEFLQEYQLNRLCLYELPSAWLSLEGFIFAYETAGPAERMGDYVVSRYLLLFETVKHC